MTPLFGYRMGSLRLLSRAGLLLTVLFLAQAALGTDFSGAPGEKEVVYLEGSGPSLTQLGQAVAELGIDSASVVVVAAPQIADSAAPTDKQVLEALRLEVRKGVAALVPRAKYQEPKALASIEARALARTRDLALTFIEPKLRAGQLELTLTVRNWSPSFWLRALAPSGVVIHRARFSVPADEQVRRVFPREKKLLVRKKRGKMPVSSPLAVSCGDLGQGRQEILIVGRQEIVIGAFAGERFAVRARAPYGNLSPIAAAPLRAPMGAATITRRGVLVGNSDREDLLLLDAQLRIRGRGGRAYPLGGDRCAVFSEAGLSPEVTTCPQISLSTEPKRSSLRTGESLDLLSIGTLSQISGVSKNFTAKLAAGETAAELAVFSSLSGEKVVQLKGLGAQAALGDVDGDGMMDLVASRGETEGEPDLLSVLTHLESEPAPLARHEMPPIHALALCPFSGKNPLSLVVASGDDLLFFE